MNNFETRTVVIYGSLIIIMLALTMIVFADDLARVKRAVRPQLIWVNRSPLPLKETAPDTSQGPQDVVWDLDA